jgi:uncharacterized protein with PQ loop repeat
MDNLVALASNTLICLVLLPQLIRLFKKKKARYLSFWLLVLIMPATLCWGVFGWLEHQNMIVAYSLTTAFVNLLTLVLYLTSNQFQYQSGMYRSRSHQLLGMRRRDY